MTLVLRFGVVDSGSWRGVIRLMRPSVQTGVYIQENVLYY